MQSAAASPPRRLPLTSQPSSGSAPCPRTTQAGCWAHPLEPPHSSGRSLRCGCWWSSAKARLNSVDQVELGSCGASLQPCHALFLSACLPFGCWSCKLRLRPKPRPSPMRLEPDRPRRSGCRPPGPGLLVGVAALSGQSSRCSLEGPPSHGTTLAGMAAHPGRLQLAATSLELALASSAAAGT